MKSLPIPLYMQGVETLYCVPYSLLGIAEYYGIKVSKPQMIAACKTHKRLGSHAVNYSQGIKTFGLKFLRLKFSFQKISRAIQSGTPIVICYKINENESHFSTIIGARKDSRGIPFFTLNDTFYGRYELPSELLQYLMKKDCSWMRAVVPL